MKRLVPRLLRLKENFVVPFFVLSDSISLSVQAYTASTGGVQTPAHRSKARLQTSRSGVNNEAAFNPVQVVLRSEEMQ